MLRIKRLLKMKIFFLFLIVVFFSSCRTTGYFIQDSNIPVSDTRKYVTSLFGRPRALSANGRELFSDYHNEKFEFLEDSTNVEQRFYTKVTILGPRRPYEIQVEVYKELYELETDAFVDMGVDETLSYRRAAILQKTLKEIITTRQGLDGDLPF